MPSTHRFRPALEGLEVRRLLSPLAVGALGDSYTDEYRFYPPDQSQARNWVEILATTRGVNFGPFTTQNRGEPRDQGFAFNWARDGASSNDMIGNQLPGLVAQVATGKVECAWMFTGGIDFLQYLEQAAVGAITPSKETPALRQVETNAAANFHKAVDSLLAASPTVKLVVATLPDVRQLPVVRAAATHDPAARPLLAATAAAVARYNATIRAEAKANPRVALVDLAHIETQLVRHAGSQGSLPYGGIQLDLIHPGDDYHHGFIADGLHAGTIVQGIIADAFIRAVDTKFGARLVPLREQQIVAFASHFSTATP